MEDVWAWEPKDRSRKAAARTFCTMILDMMI
jgi:hypothetical protein